MHTDNLQFLQQNRYFAEFTREEIKAFSDHLHEQTFAAGASLFVEGEEDFSWYMIVEGIVVILRDSPVGPPHTLAELTTGEAFGEMALIEHTARMASAIALHEVRVLRLDAATFTQLLKEKDAVATGLLLQMAATQCRRLRKITTILQEITDEQLEAELLDDQKTVDLNTAIRHRYFSEPS